MTDFETFKVKFDTNEIITMTETNNQIKTKVEPRIMHVLQILIENSPNVVLRDQLIDEVWNNYGGADDALNQAISHLRKTLQDTDKKNRIIETVIKKGYRFSSKVQHEQLSSKSSTIYKNKYFSLIVLIVIVLASVSLTFLYTNDEKAPLVPVSDETKTNDSTTPAPKVE